MSGWYPDPGGEPDRYRYWDGTSWSDETSPEPGPPPPPTPSGRRRAILLAAVAVAVVAIVLAAWSFGRTADRPYTDDPLPTPRLSGGDDSSPSGFPSLSPSVSPSPSPVGLCARGQPDTRSAHPQDSRVRGGNLSYPAAPELDPAAPEPRLSFAWDVTQQVKSVHARPGWLAQIALGQLRRADGFGASARRVAEQALRCTVTSTMYEPYTATRADRRSTATTVDGRRGWLIETDILVAVDGLPFAGDHVFLVVVPDGEDWSFFFSATPNGDQAFAAVATRAREALTVS